MHRFVFLTLLLFSSLQANIGPQGFYEFNYNRVFVETGTLSGDAIQKALDAGFKIVHSLDIEPGHVNFARRRFQGIRNVHIYLKDSGKQLSDVIQPIREPITFWLDAHNGFPDPNRPDIKNCPLFEELDQIKQHKIKTHTILIDDMHCCGTLFFDFITIYQLIEKLLEINPDYDIFFIPGGDDGEYPENVLVAKPK